MALEDADRSARRATRRGWTEIALCLLLALALAAGAQLLATRGEAGLERYRLDRLAGRVAIPAASMLEAYCRELGTLVAPRPEPCAAPLGEVSAAPPAAAAMNAFAERLDARARAVDAALATLSPGVDWRVVSEGYVVAPDDDALKFRLREAWGEIDRARDESQSVAQLARRFDRRAVAKAVDGERADYAGAVRRADWPAAGATLLRWASLLDGKGEIPAAKTVAYMLGAQRIAERARQAEALVRHGGLLWLGWAAWLCLAAAIGRQPLRPLPTLAALLLLALALAGAEQRWLEIRLPVAIYWTGGLLVSLALLLDQWAGARAWAAALPRRRAASPWLLPGWLLFVGIGWLLLADLSLHFHPRLRFLLLEHFAGVWAALLLLGLLPLLARPAIAALAWLLGRAGAPTLGGRVFGASLLILVPAAAGLAASELAQVPQHHTGEALKAIALLYAAWFLLLRAPLLKAGGLTADLRAWAIAGLPAGLALLAIAAAFWLTRDLGPLLVLLLCVLIWAGAFLGWRLMLATTALAFGALFAAGGTLSPIVAERLRSVLDPYTSATDDLARLLWFQQEVPPAGFGLGQVPWCGYAAQERCLGLPLQTASDYTFTALLGVAGDGAWLVVALIGLWAIALMRSRWHSAVDPCALLAGRNALHEGWRAWLAVVVGTLVMVQLGVTVAGNLAWIPLSGITLPFVSYGSAALLTLTAFLALLSDETVEEPDHA